MRATRIAVAIAALTVASLSIANATGAGKPIVIGFAIGETGFIQPYDVPGFHSWQLVINAQNKKGGLLGRKITTTSADTKSDINQGTVAGNQVLSKGASFMVVTCDYNYGGAAARVANAHHIVVFSICAGDPHFGRQGIGKYAFTDNDATPTEGAAVAEFAHSKGWRHIYQLVDTSVDYDKSLCSYMEDRWKMYGLKLAGKDTFTNTDTSIATQVSRLKATPGVDAVFVCSYPPGGATAVKQLRNSGVNLPIIGGDAFDGTFWLRQSEPEQLLLAGRSLHPRGRPAAGRERLRQGVQEADRHDARERVRGVGVRGRAGLCTRCRRRSRSTRTSWCRRSRRRRTSRRSPGRSRSRTTTTSTTRGR